MYIHLKDAIDVSGFLVRDLNRISPSRPYLNAMLHRTQNATGYRLEGSVVLISILEFWRTQYLMSSLLEKTLDSLPAGYCSQKPPL